MTDDPMPAADGLLRADGAPADGPPGTDAAASPRRPTRVVAVLVTHDGLPWLDRALDAVLAQTRRPDVFHVVDTGSIDGGEDLLATRAAADPTITTSTLDRATGFGAAVAHATATEPAGPTPTAQGSEDWVWLLHDDCAPEPDALAQLLVAAESASSAAVLGPKIVGWADPRHLLEVGVTIARSGSRDTGLERHEQDQGQHDAQRSVLAVSTAGMLVRRSVWDELGGLDPQLPLFRDDIDFGWRVNAAGHRVLVVPDAVVHHAEAASHRRRRIAVGPDQPHRLDRFHAMQVLLANMPTALLPWVVLRLIVGTLVRSLAFLVGKDPGFALAELRALGSTLAHPGRVRAARRSRRVSRVVGYRDLSGLLAAPGTQLRHAVDVAAGVLAAGPRAPSRLGSSAQRRPDPGTSAEAAAQPTDGAVLADDRTDAGSGTDTNLLDAGVDGVDDADGADGTSGEQPERERDVDDRFVLDEDLYDLEGRDGIVRRLRRRPGVVLLLVSTVVAVVAARGLLGAGSLLGGSLLPAPGGAGDLWSTYLAAWHPVALGSGEQAGAYLPVLALASIPVLGKAWLVVDILLLLAVPLAALTAYLALRDLVVSIVLRVWAAVAYAVLPAALGAVATGRLGTALLLVLLPVLARPVLRLAGVLGPDATWRTVWGTGLAVALVAAFVPIVWVLLGFLAVLAAVTSARSRDARLRLLAALAIAPVVLLPWTWTLVTDPSYLLVEAGVVSPSFAPDGPGPLGALLLGPGGPGAPPVWVGLGLVLAALAAYVRGVRRRETLVACSVALVALLLAVVLARTSVRTPQLDSSVPAWPGALLVVAGAALVVAAVFSAEGLRERLAGRSFGWQQPVVALVVVLCVLGPAVAALGWLTGGAGDPLRRASPSVLPAFVSADALSPDAPRTLVLRADDVGAVGYSVLRGDGLRLGDAEVVTAAGTAPRLDSVVSDVSSGRGAADGGALVTYGIRYVVGDVDDTGLTRTLDGTAGLRRVSSGLGEGPGDPVWRVTATTGRARLVPTEGETVVLPSDGTGVDGALPEAWTGGRLEISEVADAGWRATLDGQALTGVVVGGWQQGFEVPPGAGTIEVEYDDPTRGRVIAVQGVLVLVVLVLALPAIRRDGEGEDA